jgi:hypothetical protein
MAHLDAHQTVALGIFRSPKSTPVHEPSAICLQELFASQMRPLQAQPPVGGARDEFILVAIAYSRMTPGLASGRS